MTISFIADVVFNHASPLQLDVAAHECRRTFAKLALKGGARLEQIQLSLGHQSIQTTQRYLGVELD
jgi:site-specific recombinase XerD